MRVIQNVYSAEQVVAHLSPVQPVINVATLDTWVRSMQTAVNDMIVNQRDHDNVLSELKKQYGTLSLMVHNITDFMEFIDKVHPEVMEEYRTNRKTSQRLTK